MFITCTYIEKRTGRPEAMPGGSTSSKSALGPNSTVSCRVWNVREFVQRDHCRLRESVILAKNLDIVCLCETFLRKL